MNDPMRCCCPLRWSGLILFLLASLLTGADQHVRAAGAADALGGTPQHRSAGEVIYVQQCAACHGKAGEGVADKCDEPLYGDRPLSELLEVIEATMPEEDPSRCVGQEAAQVARYVFETFYSPAARRRNQPPRIDLVHLTARQYQQSVADLLSSFSGRPGRVRTGGLRGRYFKTRNFRGDEQVIDRLDAHLRYDFGAASPDPEQIDPQEFSIRWEGSLLAPETGDYELIVRSQNGVRLWLNNQKQPRIDGWVSSGNQPRELTCHVRLLAGRPYPLRIDLFKYKEQSASLVVQWKPPHGVRRDIPADRLSPDRVPESFVVTIPLPADDSSAGYERGSTVSPQWQQAVARASLQAADYVLADLQRHAGCDGSSEGDRDSLVRFAERFVERAFRRPLSAELEQRYVTEPFAEAETFSQAIKQVITQTLNSPRFLYVLPPSGPPDNWQASETLALILWDSLPDKALREAATSGKLRDSRQVQGHARRMLDDPRADAKLRDFFHWWLSLDEAEDLARDPEKFPGFDAQLLADLRESLERFIADVFWSGRSDFRELLLGDYLLMNSRLAAFYGADVPEDGQFHKVRLPEPRAGLVTHPYLMTMLAYYQSSSPIHRGVFASRKVLGRTLRPPPMAIQFMDSRFDPQMTMRQKVTELTKGKTCQACHRVINPLGFSLEHFDAVGRYRTEEKGQPIVAVSDYPNEQDEVVHLRDGVDLARYAADSPMARQNFIRHLFEYLVKHPPEAYGARTIEFLDRKFVQSDYHMQKLTIEIARVVSLYHPPRVPRHVRPNTEKR